MPRAMKHYRFCPDCGAPLALGVKFGRTRASCRYCGFIHFTDPKVAVGALLTDGERVLLVRRGAIPRQGFWALPAGFMDSDEVPEEALVREIREETGVQARAGELLRVTTLGGWEERRGLLLLYAAEPEREGRPPGTAGSAPGESNEPDAAAGDDVTDAAWFAADEIPWDQLAFESTAEILGDWIASLTG